MDQDALRPCWIRGSKIEEVVWIGKEVIGWCTGLCITFFNTAKKSHELRWCVNAATGEGARCISGHLMLPIFAFSEKCSNPRILVYAYPSMTKISECVRGCKTGYLETAFTARDHIVSIGRYPDFPMIIWCWKTGEKIAVMETSMHNELEQSLRISQTSPIMIAQVGKTCGRLVTWELSIVAKTAVLRDHEIKLPKGEPVLAVDWCPSSSEPLLAITDIDGHIFLSNLDGTNVYRIVLSQRCGICVDSELPMICWFRGGIVLKTTFCQIRFFRRHSATNTWRKIWYVKSETKPYILSTHPANHDFLFYHTLEGYLMQIDFSEPLNTPIIKRYLQHGSFYRFIDFIYPWCHHLAAQEQTKELVFLERYSGTEVARFDLDLIGDVTTQASHPDHPLIFVLSTQGELLVTSALDPQEPVAVFYIRLHKAPVDLMRFSYCGRFFVAAQKKSGKCFCGSLEKSKAYRIRAVVHVGRKVADVVLYDAKQSLKLLVLPSEAAHFSVGQLLVLFDVPSDQDLITEETGELELPGVYRKLSYVPGNPQLLIGSPYLSRQLRVQKLQDFKDSTLVDGISSGHQVKLAYVFVDRRWITSAASDGLVFIRNKNVRRVLASCMAHHRQDLGTVKAVANRDADMIVCLGVDGSLVAMVSGNTGQRESEMPGSHRKLDYLHRVDYSWYEKAKPKMLADFASLDPSVMGVLTPSGDQVPWSKEDIWEDWRAKMQLRREASECADKKIAILLDFKDLKGKIKALLDTNDACTDIERLSVAAFDLDKVGREMKLKAAKDEREDTHMKFEHECGEMERVSQWIRTTFWEPQVVLGKSLFAIFGNKEVSNYTLVEEDPLHQDRLQWAQFCRDSVRILMENETFRPWHRYTEKELETELRRRTTLLRSEDMRRMEILFDEEEREVDQIYLDELKAMEGMTTHHFIEQSAQYFSQMELYAFGHTVLNNRFLVDDCRKLRLFFNRTFDEVCKMKEREMNATKERIARIRHIGSELKLMFDMCVPHVPMDPEWRVEEIPESTITVLEDEVKTRPYVSSSQQELLDQQAAEDERLRQLLLADDFYEKALMKMMDGVLEIRWEDIIKIDVPKPRCMLEKKPEEYNKEDLIAARKYEKDVNHLLEERERYKRILEADYAKINALLQEGVDKFNAKLNELFQLKVSVEAAINQMNLHYIRGCMRSFYRVKTLEEEIVVKDDMNRTKEYEAILEEHAKTFEVLCLQLAEQYESICNREKAMPKKFYADFVALGKTSCAFLERHYKRRPKTNLKNVNPSDLCDLGVCMLFRSHQLCLPPECQEYLRSLQNYDVQPLLATPIESHHWDQLIRHRRQKIDAELKMKSKQTELAEAESIINQIRDRIIECKGRMDILKKRLQQTRRERLVSEQDTELQLVLKMGQVEVNLQGEMCDTENSLFITRQEIETVNSFIEEAGSRKLASLTRALASQKGTVFKEWKHGCLRRRMHDLREDLHLVQSVTLTKEMQEFLKRSARGWKDEKSAQQLDRDIQATRARWAKMLGKHEGRLREIEREIAAGRSKNEALDQEIVGMNVARCEMELRRDLIAEAEHRGYMDRKMRMLTRRSDLIRTLQDNYAGLLALQTEHELLRLRRYPVLEFKIVEPCKDKHYVCRM